MKADANRGPRVKALCAAFEALDPADQKREREIWHRQFIGAVIHDYEATHPQPLCPPHPSNPPSPI